MRVFSFLLGSIFGSNILRSPDCQSTCFGEASNWERYSLDGFKLTGNPSMNPEPTFRRSLIVNTQIFQLISENVISSAFYLWIHQFPAMLDAGVSLGQLQFMKKFYIVPSLTSDSSSRPLSPEPGPSEFLS